MTAINRACYSHGVSVRNHNPVPDATVRDGQQVLNRLRAPADQIAEDGLFGPQTERAVRDFQRSENLEVTGELDELTWERLEVAIADGREFDVRPTIDETFQFQGRTHNMSVDRVTVNEPTTAQNRSNTGSATAPSRSSSHSQNTQESSYQPNIRSDRRNSFEVSRRSTEQLESGGGRAYQSTLRTTAGDLGRASFGSGQLTSNSHLTNIIRSPELRERLGVSLDEATLCRDRAGSVRSWYRAVGAGELPAIEGFSREENVRVAMLTSGGNVDELINEFGARFQEQTGLPPTDLRNMLLGRPLHDPALRSEYARISQERFGAMPRNSEQRREVAETLVQRHPELNALRDRIGTPAIGYHMSNRRLNEEVAGWQTLAIRNTLGSERFDRVMAEGSAESTAMRHEFNFNRALRAAGSTLDSAPEDQRTRTLALVARCYHALPRDAALHFFDEGRPRFTTPESLERAAIAFLGQRSAATTINAIEREQRRGAS